MRAGRKRVYSDAVRHQSTMLADRRQKSLFSRITAMLNSLKTSLGWPAAAERVPAAHVTFTPPAEGESTHLEALQLAHDLRNQLMVMMACLNALRDGVPNSIDELRDAAERTAVLIDSLLLGRHGRPGERLALDVNDAVRH